MQGKDREFEEFYCGHHARLRRLAYRLTADWSQADDLAQDAMVRTYRAWRRIRDRERADLYVRRVLLNRHRSIVRRTIIGRRAERIQFAQPVHEAPEDHIAVWSEVQRLPVREKQALVLHYYEGLPQTQIALVMGCPNGTVNSLVYRGLQKLRTRLRRDEILGVDHEQHR